MEDSPDFFFDPGTCPYRAGVRPFRKETYRLEPETVGSKFVVHNYGHGGAGITMSWGCAEVVRDIVVRQGTSGGVAVLGAGVMGLTAATLLAEARPKIAVTVYADKFTPHTTSDVAGGQWSPSFVVYKKDDPAAKNAYFDVLRRARKAHEKRGAAYGVSQRPNYTTVPIDHLDELPTDIVPKATKLPHLPFQNLNGPGFRYDILLVEPPILMSKMQRDLEAAGVVFIKRKFQSATELANLKEATIVNCTGLGGGKLFDEEHMMDPIKGQLVFLKPQPNLKYLFSGKGYVFPRADAVIVGGSHDHGVDDDKPDPTTCKNMVEIMKGIFDGTPSIAEDAPAWLVQGK
jgi:D-amino-acid oxidase